MNPGAAIPGQSSYCTSAFSTPPFLGLEGIPRSRAAAMLSSPILLAGPRSATTQSTDLLRQVTRALQPRTTPAVLWTISGGTTMYDTVSESTYAAGSESAFPGWRYHVIEAMTPRGNTLGSLSSPSKTMSLAQSCAQITLPSLIFIPPLARNSLPESSTIYAAF